MGGVEEVRSFCRLPRWQSRQFRGVSICAQRTLALKEANATKGPKQAQVQKHVDSEGEYKDKLRAAWHAGEQLQGQFTKTTVNSGEDRGQQSLVMRGGVRQGATRPKGVEHRRSASSFW